MPADIHSECGRKVFYDPKAGRYGHLATGSELCPTPDMKDFMPAEWNNELTLRRDGRLQVADTKNADQLYGCTLDHWCILRDGHAGNCNEDRE